MKIYGNSRSDGFTMFVVLVSAVFIGSGFLLSMFGGLALLVAVPVMLALVALMVVRARKWDVMSEAPAVAVVAGPVLTTFPVKADTEAVATSGATVLPLPVDKPKSAVETNTAVA